MTVTGVGSSLSFISNNQLFIQGGTLNIEDGATSSTPSLRTYNLGEVINISGGATHSGGVQFGYFDVSAEGGEINISGTGTTMTAGIDNYGSNLGGETVVTVSQGATLSGANYFGGVRVGSSGSELVVTGTNSEASYNFMTIGHSADSSSKVTVASNGTLVAGTVNVGGTANNAVGTLEVNGGTVEGATAGVIVFRIGLHADSTGTVLITNNGSIAISPNNTDNSFFVGGAGTGFLTISDGGSLTHNFDSFIGRDAGSTGTALVDGATSSWTVGGLGTNTLHVGVDGTGSLTLANGGTVTAGTVIIGENGTLAGDGFIGGAVSNSGLVSPGNSTGILYATGGFTQTATGTLEIGIGGLIAGTEFDQISNFMVPSDATLAGSLNILQVNDFNPADGDSFLILDFTASGGSIFGEFDSISAFNLGSGLAWDFDNLYIDGTISVIPEPAAMAALLGALALVLVGWRRSRRAGQFKVEV